MKVNTAHLMSPWNLGGVVGILGISSTFLPPEIYGYYAKEKNYMFFNINALFFLIASITFFCMASYFSYQVFTSIKSRRKEDGIFYIKTTWVSACLAFIMLLLTLYQIYSINQEVGISLILSQVNSGGGGEARQAVSEAISSSKVGWVSALFGYILVYFTWSILNNKSRINIAIYIFSFVLFLISSSISLSRDTIITTILMCGVVFITNSIKRKTFKLNFQIGRLLIAIVLLAIVFFGVDYIRSGGKYSIDVAMTQLVGYFPASYNRMAAIVGGNMQYPDANWGYYTFQMLWDTPVVKPITQTIFAVKDSLIPATSYNNWVGQFGAVWAAGLNPKYIWATAFGFAFSDFGYLAFFFFIFYGIISGYAYAEFGKNRIVFMILYPLIAVSVLKWWSILYISQRTTIICILLGILLSALSFIVKNIKIKRFHL